jgi:hypothetical protein
MLTTFCTKVRWFKSQNFWLHFKSWEAKCVIHGLNFSVFESLPNFKTHFGVKILSVFQCKRISPLDSGSFSEVIYLINFCVPMEGGKIRILLSTILVISQRRLQFSSSCISFKIVKALFLDLSLEGHKSCFLLAFSRKGIMIPWRISLI